MASLVSGNVTVRYDEASGVVGAGSVVLAATSRLAAAAAAAAATGNVAASGVAAVASSTTSSTTTTTTTTTMKTTTNINRNPMKNNNKHGNIIKKSVISSSPSSSSSSPTVSMNDVSNEVMDCSNGSVVASTTTANPSPALAMVKAEIPERAGGSSLSSASSVSGHVGTGGGLFAGIASSNKRPRPDDWLTPNSPSSPQGHIQNQHVIYTTGGQQTVLAQHSSPLNQPKSASNNGYASPMSSASGYDPYSPNGKIGKSFSSSHCYFNIIIYGSNLICTVNLHLSHQVMNVLFSTNMVVK